MAVYGVSCAISMIIHHFGYFGGAFFPIYRGKITILFQIRTISYGIFLFLPQISDIMAI